MAIDHRERTQTVTVGPETDLTEILDMANEKPIVLDRGGIRYVVERESATPLKPFDTEAFQDTLRALQEAFAASGIDADQLKREIRRERGHDDVAE